MNQQKLIAIIYRRNKPRLRNITIKPVLNGFLVTVGCQELVFESIDKLINELTLYLKDPELVEKYYIENGINAKYTMRQPLCPAECAEQEVNRTTDSPLRR